MRQWFTSSKFFKRVSLLAGATVAAQLISLVCIPMLARLYTPQDFGVLAVYLFVIATITVVASLCFESAIPLPKDDETAAHILQLTVCILLVLTIVIGAVTYLFGKDLLGLLHGRAFIPYVWLLPVGFAGAGLYQLLNYWAVRKKDYLVLARTKVSQSGGRALTQLGMGWMQMGAVGLIAGQIVGQAAGAFSFYLLFRRHLQSSKPSFLAADIHKVVSRYNRFPKFFAPGALLYSVGLNLPPLLLAGFYGLDTAGYFLLAQRAVGIPLTIIGDSIAEVYHAEAADIVRNTPSRLRDLFFRIAGKLFLLAVLPAVLLLTVGQRGFVLILGETWRTAGSYAAILSLMFFMRFVAAPLTTTLSLLEKQHFFLIVQIILVVASAGSILVSGTLGLTHKQTVGVFSVTMCLAYLIEFVILALLVIRSSLELGRPATSDGR